MTCPICQKDTLSLWLQCDACNQWFHGKCVDLDQSSVNEIVTYHCPQCTKTNGPSEYRRKLKRARVNIDYVALNEGEVFAVDKSEHPHVNKFREFKPEVHRDDTKLALVDVVHELTVDMARTSHLTKPVLVPQGLNSVGMEFPAPKEDITIDYIMETAGSDTPVEVMDVLSQQGVSPGWNMQQWRDYFVTNDGDRDRIRNVISLEISDIDHLGKQFVRPQMVRDLDLIDKTWCDKTPRPQVTIYCLMSVSRSFTDFHIDFGGTSVYYTVCSGSKTFLMFPPTKQNLELYTLWCLEQNQNFIWYPEYSKSVRGKPVFPSGGFKVTLKPGDVFIIPSGWIHCVYTPEDSIVIGGNFLTAMNIETQLDIYDIEKVTKVPMKFRHPQFNKVLWYASWYYYNHREEFERDVGGGVVGGGGEEEKEVKEEKEEKEEQKDKETVVKKESLSENDNVEHSTKNDIVVKDNTKNDIHNLDTSQLPLPKAILSRLLSHLQSHYELSKSNPVAKKSIPSVVGKDIPKYFEQLQLWINSY